MSDDSPKTAKIDKNSAAPKIFRDFFDVFPLSWALVSALVKVVVSDVLMIILDM